MQYTIASNRSNTIILPEYWSLYLCFPITDLNGILSWSQMFGLLRRPSVDFGLMLIAVGYQFAFSLYSFNLTINRYNV